MQHNRASVQYRGLLVRVVCRVLASSNYFGRPSTMTGLVTSHTFDMIMDASARYPKAAGYRPAYGTAGFRTRASNLDSTLFRCGMLAALRALKTGKAVGLMVTASHNPECDNGVKLIEPTGEMLVPAWEAHATTLAQAETDEAVAEAVRTIADCESLSTLVTDNCVVFVGADTRPSSPALVAAACDGIRLFPVALHNVGACTTPMLHYDVWAHNSGLDQPERYFKRILSGFSKIIAGGDLNARTELLVDCANGVGARAVLHIQSYVSQHRVELDICNMGTAGLNHHCGSDYVQKRKVIPNGVPGILPKGCLCCSIDGDADRIVFFTIDTAGNFLLLDGDRIAVLTGIFIKEAIADAAGDLPDISVGVVQTAYANGAATSYIRTQLEFDTVLAKTGVKHLHHAAKEFDIGIYFEANGHGTVLFSERLRSFLGTCCSESQGVKDLQAMLEVVNQAVGDALSIALLVVAVLRRKQWTVLDWASLYQDLPSRQSTLLVKDRNAITTANSETRCVTPCGLQAEIDKFVARFDSARAFVRPSGTEDLVRVYAEAAGSDQCDQLSLEILRAVHQFADGLGDPPSSLA